MLRSFRSKLFVPVAGLALLLGLGVTTRADEPTTMPAAKGSIVVTVVDADGKPVDGATVSYVVFAGKKKGAGQAPTDANATAPIPVKTDADGKATLTAVADGDFTVSVKMKGTGAGKQKVTVADGKETDVTVTLKPKKAKN